MEDPGGAENFKFGDWTAPYGNDEIAEVQREGLFSSDALLRGPVTSEGFAAAWPKMKHEEDDVADRMKSFDQDLTPTLRGDTAMRSTSRGASLPQAEDNGNAQEEWGGRTKGVGNYADVNGIKLYYETHGTGRPLILLHGGLGATSMFGPNLPALAKGRQVIAVDLQGHGRTADIDRPLSTELMADDIAALIKYLKLDQPDIMGYSLGGASPS